EELQSNVSVANSSPTAGGVFKEHNYLGPSGLAEDDKAAISLKATELTLGLLLKGKLWIFMFFFRAQIVGWPQVRSFRKNTMATTCSAALFVKVSMDGAPYLRKVDLRSYTNYMELSSALEKMFTTFTLGQCGSNRATWKDKLSETKLKDILNGKDYVLMKTRMEIGCVLEMFHWTKMFIDVCKKLKIMKGCNAIGLAAAPRAMEKSSKMRA
uniref:Auxin-responsive protein n=2 Tax=Brassica oleracea TaxID=3712 RepID=A0A0D3DQS1_BRAOL